MTASELLRELTLCLKQAGTADARLEARYLTAYVLQMDAKELSPISEIPVSAETYIQVQTLVQRRLNGEPLQYLLGKWEFMGLPFKVSPDVLIPRADTEILCEKALRMIEQYGCRTVLDLCCGSGCIGISIAKWSGADVTLADISEPCLSTVKENASMNGVTVETVQSDLFSNLTDRKFDLICCNPPYLSKQDMLELQREVCFEPSLALYGGTDGLDFYRRIEKEFRNHLQPNGKLLLEIGCTQAHAVASIFQSNRIFKDYADHPRVIVAEA